MKKLNLFLILFFLLTSVLPSLAQSKYKSRSPEEKAKMRTEKMKTGITGLSESQLTKIEAVNLKYSKKIKSIEKTANKNRGEVREKQSNEIKSILSPSQVEEYQALILKYKNKRKHHKKP